MCYDSNAQPPTPPGASGLAKGEEISLTAADGTQFMAYVAHPAQPSKSQIIIYPDVRGLHQFYKDLALRFAEVGYPAIAIDYFGRTAGLSARDDSFEFWPHVQQLQIETFTQDVQAAQNYVQTTFGAGSQFPVGFCMGGSLVLTTGMNTAMHFGGLIVFYAGLSRAFGGQGTVLENADKIAFPVLGMFGAADQGIPQEQVQTLDVALAKKGIDHTIIRYEGAPHSFFDRKAAEFADASADAWQQILAFIPAHTAV